MSIMIDLRLQRIRVDVYTEIEHQGAKALASIARQASSARRALGQRIRKLTRDLHNDQSTK